MADRQSATLIGAGTFVRGRITGTGDLEIAGRIDAEFELPAELSEGKGGGKGRR